MVFHNKLTCWFITVVVHDELAQQASTQACGEFTFSPLKKIAPAVCDSLVLMIVCRLMNAIEHLLLHFNGLRSFSFSISINFSGSFNRADSCGSSRICCISLSSIFSPVESDCSTEYTPNTWSANGMTTATTEDSFICTKMTKVLPEKHKQNTPYHTDTKVCQEVSEAKYVNQANPCNSQWAELTTLGRGMHAWSETDSLRCTVYGQNISGVYRALTEKERLANWNPSGRR